MKKEDIIFAIGRYFDEDEVVGAVDEYDIIFFVKKISYRNNNNSLKGIIASDELINIVHEQGYLILDEDLNAFEEDGQWTELQDAIENCKEKGFIHDEILQKEVNIIIHIVGQQLIE